MASRRVALGRLLRAPRVRGGNGNGNGAATRRDVVSELTSSVTSIVNEPSVFLLTLVAALLVGTEILTPCAGWGVQWLAQMAAGSTALPVAKFLARNYYKALGALCFAPAWLSVPQSKRMTAGAAMLFWLLVVPEAGVWEYVLQALAIRAYFRVRMPMARVLVIALVVLAYWSGFGLTIPKYPPPTKACVAQFKNLSLIS